MDATRELAQLLECLCELLARSVEQRAGLVGLFAELRLDEPEVDGERDEPLLCAVVQVPLEGASCLVLGPHDACPGGAELLFLPAPERHVASGDEHELASSRIEDWPRRPRDQVRRAVALEPPRLALVL